MEVVAKSQRKPAFVYLHRDRGYLTYEPFETLHEYINLADSFAYLRDMCIFSSLNGYELDRRPSAQESSFWLSFERTN